MNSDLVFHIKCLTRAIYFVTDEEDRFILELQELLKDSAKRTFVFNGTFGLKGIDDYIADWSTRAHAEMPKTSPHDALVSIYKEDTKKTVPFYVFTDPERWLRDEHIQRRVLNILHQGNDIRYVKILIFVGPRKFIPPSLQRYIHVINDKGLTAEETSNIVNNAASLLKLPPPNDTTVFRGLTAFEIKSSISQSIIRTKVNGREGCKIEPGIILDYKRQQLSKTDLLQYVDTSKFSFNDVGGIHRFKAWAMKTRACWTPEGRAFGLKPPKGVLCVGVWGCGKSLSTKALGHAWKLPVVQLEMGKLRSNQVGESEGNIYRALRIIEAVAPCIVWIDEAEKSLAGAHSSSQSDAGTTSRVIGILSTWLQETDAPVCVAMTANSLGNVPIEFVNRMDERFFFDLPSEEDRTDILKIHLKKAGQDPSKFELAELAEKAKHMVGREIEQAIGAAMMDSFNAEKPHLDPDILSKSIVQKPRIVKTMVDELEAVRAWVGYDPEIDDGIRARYAAKPERDQDRDLKFVEPGA